MNTFFPLSHNQKFSNTTSLSNGILKKLAITLAVSAIGVSTLVPIAHAESEVVAQPGDIITIEEDDDIYGISGVFADGGTLTVKNGGASSADQLSEAAGADGIIEQTAFFSLVQETADSSSGKLFLTLMGDKVNADGSMKVEDILDYAHIFDVLDDLDENSDNEGPVSVEDIVDAVPDGVSNQKKRDFTRQLEEEADEDGNIAYNTAKEKLIEFVLENPGNELEQIEGGTISAIQEGGVGIHLKSEKDLTLDNEVEVIAEDRAIVVISGKNENELTGDVTVINSGDLKTSGGGTVLTAAGKNVTVENSGEIESYSETSRNGIHVIAAETVNITNTGEIELSTENESDAISTSSDGGDITIDNDGDLTISGEKGNGIEADSGHKNESGVFSGGGNITIKNTGKIVASGNKAIGIKSGSHGGDVTINNFADVIGDGAGIGIETAKKGTITNSGDITAKGEDSSGMFILADDTASLTNTGNVEVEGQLGLAAIALNSASIDNSGDVSLVRNWSEPDNYWNPAINANSFNSASIKNSGEVTTSGNNMLGLSAENKTDHFENPEDAEEGTQLASIINSGNISTTGDGSTAISATSGENTPDEGEDAIIGSDVSVENSGALSTMGKEAIALQAWSNGGSVDVTNEGAITTLKADSEGIDASSGTRKEINGTKTQAGESVKVTNSSNISTKGEDSEGIYANSYGGTVEVDNSGDISTTGLESSAISLGSGNSRKTDGYVPLRGSDVTLKNSGVLSTTGKEAEGLHASSNGGDVTATNEGKIITGGEKSHGIKLSSGNTAEDETTTEQDGGDITIKNTGIIDTTGDKAYNISTWTNGGTTTITNEAKLTATGENSRGIKANSGHEEDGKIITAGGDITIKNTGEIVGTGEGIDGSMGIKAESVADKDQGGDVKIENSGNVTATGGGIGIEAAKNGEMTNSGDITVKGEDSGGLLILAEDTALLTNTGNVEVEGFLGLAAGALNSASVDNSGDISLVRNWSKPDDYWNPAIGAISANDASIKNSGKVTTSDNNMIGLYAGASDSETTKKATIENSGDVTTKGSDKAHAAYISLDGTGTLTNSGSLITEGKTNAVVVEGKGGFTLDNAAAGVIEAKDGLAIVTEETKDTITNLGTIKGGADFAAGDDVLDNKGILDGNFNFGDGEDTLNLSDLSKVSAATFDGGASDDVVNLSGGGELAKDQIVNFETANLLSGDFSGDVMDKFTKLVNVKSGASLSGFSKINNLTSSGTVSVAAGETLDVNGDLNVEGGTFNLGVDSTSKHAVVNVSGDASFASTSNLFVNVVKDNSLTLDESVTVLNGKTLSFDEIIDSTAKEAEEEFDVDDDYISYDFSGRVEKAEKGDQLVLTVRDSIGSVIEEVGETYGGAIKHIASLSNDKVSEENSVLTELKKRLDEGKTQEAQELMDEVVSSPGASQIAATQNTRSFTAGNMVINRAAARVDSGYTATLSADDSSNILGYNPEYKSAPHIRNIMAMSDEGTEASQTTLGYNGEVWMQVYGVYQETGGKVSGETNAYGGAAGIDFLVGPGTVLGLGFIYSNSDSDADTANAHTDIETDTYGLTAYGMTQLDQGYRLGGSLAYYWNSHDLKRQILTNQMEADYDSTTFVARAELGREFDMGDYTFMPQIGGIYTTNSADPYTETGPLAQAVSSTDTDSFIGQVGFVVNSQQEWNGILVRPEFHMNLLHEFNDELGSFSGALAADNSVNVSSTITSTVETRYNIGGGLKLNHTTAFSSDFGYDGIFAEDTQEHLFRYKASYKY